MATTYTANAILGKPGIGDAGWGATLNSTIDRADGIFPIVPNVAGGGADDTAAIQAAITLAGTGGTVLIPKGTFNFTSLRIQNSYVHLIGMGVGVSKLKYVPSGAGTALLVQAGTSVPIIRGSVRDLTFTTDDSTYSKICLNIVDGSEYVVDRVEITSTVSISGTYTWTGGAASTGIKINGRQFILPQNVWISADIPLEIGKNPNSSVDLDHSDFKDLYLLANGNPCLLIDTGLILTNDTFRELALVKGTNGVRWIDTTSATVSSGIIFENIRHEQGSSAAGYIIDIEHNTSIQSLILSNVYGGLNTNGIKLRKTIQTLINNYTYVDSAKVSLDVNATVAPLELRNCLGKSGSTASIVGLSPIRSSPLLSILSPMPLDALYDAPAVGAFMQTQQDTALGSATVSLATSATVSVGDSQTMGMLIVTNNAGTSAIFALRAGSTPIEVSDPDSWYTVSKDSAGTVNVYWDTAAYYIQNKTATSPLYVRYFLIGSRGGF
jgi:hypothetical protein